LILIFGSQIFFWPTGVPKKLKFSKNIEKSPYRRVAQKKVKIFNQAPLNTLFFDSPSGIQIFFVYVLIACTVFKREFSCINTGCRKNNCAVPFLHQCVIKKLYIYSVIL